MKGFIVGVLVTLLVIVAVVFLTVNFALFPMGADNPPGTTEKRIANMALDNYVDKHAPKQKNPIEINSANLITGVQEYEEHCALCHGSYNQRISPMANKLNPPVPQLLRRPSHDPDENFFWITKHGIRLTGMPSWDGILTDDEIWKIVTFLRVQDKLAPEVQAAWQAAANEHNPTEHQKEMEERREHEHQATPAAPANK